VVELLAEAGIEWVAFNPGATFRGLHDSLVHGGPGTPRIALCLHESVSVAAAQAYAKAAGRPMAVMLHDVVGLQNASMAVYNAWCDRVPVLLLGGSGPAAKSGRRHWIDWIHSATDQAAVVRHHVKWDDEPRDLASVTESFARGLTTTTAVPAGPVYLGYDFDLQEAPLPEGFERPPLAAFAAPAAPAPAGADLDRLAGRLVGASAPALVTGYVGGSAAAFAAVGALADRLGARLVDTGSRFCLPTDHRLNVSALPAPLADADMVLVLDVDDPRGALARAGVPATAAVVNVSPAHFRVGGWTHDYQPLPCADEHLSASADATVGALLERLGTEPDRAAAQRADAIGREVDRHRRRRRDEAASARADGAVPRARLLHELGAALRGVDFVLANGTNERDELALWDLDRPNQYLGWHAGGGLGYGVGAAIGASLALGPDVVAVDVQADGDLLYLPSALWTAAHMQLPVLVVVHDNRQYGNSVGHAAEVGAARNRPADLRHVATALNDPPVDLAAMARSFGVHAHGPVTEVDALRAALADAVATVRAGRPALVDVITPGD
jgi:thiamine pyrophosphate-dependent acetolactate synthase large subunit-like protein